MTHHATFIGPVGGKYYDNVLVNESVGRGAGWNGKTLSREYHDNTGTTRITFEDGSWADLVTSACRSTGPGDVAVFSADFTELAYSSGPGLDQ